METNEQLYAFWLQIACGIGNRVYLHLFTRFSSFREIYECEDFSFLNGKYKCAAALRDKNLDQAFELQKRCRSMQLHVIPYYDERYPKGLRLINSPPAVLYGIGQLRDLNEMVSVAVVGTRKASAQGMQIAEDFAFYMTLCGASIVSGLARGIDASAHCGAIRAEGYTVAVLGTPIDEIYPKENTRLFHTLYKRGLVLSEMYPGCPRSPADFPNRNRIISGISRAVLIGEAPVGSGALITAREAIAQVRPLYAIPGALGDAHAGTNQLIKKGVTVATEARDILNDLSVSFPTKIHPEYLFSTPRIYAYGNQSPVRKQPKTDPFLDDSPYPEPVTEPPKPAPKPQKTGAAEPRKEPPAETNAEKILQALRERPLTADELTAETGIGVSDLLAELTMLELDGSVRSAAGNRFTRTK